MIGRDNYNYYPPQDPCPRHGQHTWEECYAYRGDPRMRNQGSGMDDGPANIGGGQMFEQGTHGRFYGGPHFEQQQQGIHGRRFHEGPHFEQQQDTRGYGQGYEHRGSGWNGPGYGNNERWNGSPLGAPNVNGGHGGQ